MNLKFSNFLFLFLFLVSFFPVLSFSAQSLYETEPNDIPAEANPFSGEGVIMGSMQNGDQDGFMWSVSDVDAQFPWSFELNGIPGAVTVFELFRITFADNSKDVDKKESLFKFGSRDGSQPIQQNDLIFEPGDYLIGLASIGGESVATKKSTGLLKLSESNIDPLAEITTDDSVESGIDETDIPPQIQYRFTITKGKQFYPKSIKQDNKDKPYSVRLNQDISIYAEQAITRSEFEFSDKDSQQRWDITGRTTIGREATVVLSDSEGNNLIQVTSDKLGKFALNDLGLKKGKYLLELKGMDADVIYNINVRSTGLRVAGDEVEPNDKWELANKVDLSRPVHGRISKKQDYDYYQFTLLDDAASLGQTISLAGQEGMQYELCLFNDSHKQMQCRSAKNAVTLTDLSLTAGDYRLLISRSTEDAEYTLSMAQIVTQKSNKETEPNDSFEFASTMNAKRIVNGSFTGQDTDYYRFTVSGEPQLWRIQVVGDGVSRVNFLDSTGSSLQEARSDGSRRTRLSNLFLLPGTHFIRITGTDGAYLLRVLPIGPPNKDLEFEPNNDKSRAMSLNFGQTRLGLLEDKGDRDFYRFKLTNDDHIRLTIEPPVDGAIRLDVRSGITGSEVTQSSDIGKSIIIEDLFKPGDYSLELSAMTPSDAEYKIKLERLPRFSCKVGCERLNIDASAQMTPSVDALNEVVATDPISLPVALTIETETKNVAAYRSVGQTLKSALTLVNSGTENIKLNIEAVTSDYRWLVDIEPSEFEIAAGTSLSLPLMLHIPQDAWSDWPVRLSIRAYDQLGTQVETYTEIISDEKSPMVGSTWNWSVPNEMLGGFNVAWQSLGGRRLPFENEINEGAVNGLGRDFHKLFDNQSVAGEGLELRGGHKPEIVPITVELAGNDSVDIVGIVLNPLAEPPMSRTLGAFELQLSDNGETFTKVFSGQLKSLAVDQYFVLDKPTPARFARLILLSSQNPKITALNLGEWKVIAKPGTDISHGKGINIADPELGGHVVWASPPTSGGSWDKAILSEEKDISRVRLSKVQRPEWVVGFHHERVAKIERLEWNNATDVDPNYLISKVKIFSSIDSPVGPWKFIGDWDINNPLVNSFSFEKPLWARYVRLVGDVVDNGEYKIYPETLRIIEQPSDEMYRSITGEWGDDSRIATYEYLNGATSTKDNLTFSGNNSKSTASQLTVNDTVNGEVKLGKESDWYSVTIPEEHNILQIVLEGDPTIRTVIALQDAQGERVSFHVVTKDVNKQVLETTVTSKQTYFIKIEEPPRSVIFAWDTSGSVGPYQNIIYNALSAYVDKVVPGINDVNFLPFGGGLLMKNWQAEPYILRTVLNDYPRDKNSSEAETALKIASEELAKHDGTKIIMVITDAITNRDPAMWKQFSEVKPRIFTVGLLASAFGGTPSLQQDLMQSWSSGNGGYYSSVNSLAEMDRAFSRANSLLDQPVSYALNVSTLYKEELGPGFLEVTAKNHDMNAVELILDASGSMLKSLNGKRRIVIAKEVLSKAVTEIIPTGTPVALRVFGHKTPNACQTDLEISLKPLDPLAATKTINKITAKNLAKTPIADSLAKLESDLGKAKGEKIVILVTDGEETCGGDPSDVLKKLAAKGINIRLNIIGFAIDDTELKSQFVSWAELGGGKYFDANDEDSLNESVTSALQIPYLVYDNSGELVAEGSVGGKPLELNGGFYSVVVSGASSKKFEKVEIVDEKSLMLEY